MALNFPDNPSVGQIFSDTTSGYYYRWDGYVWQSFSPGSSANIQTLDDISSSFNGITTSFLITSGGFAITPIKAAQLIINLGGVVQDPTDDYSVSGSNLIFSDAPDLGATFSGVSLGPAIPISDIIDGTIVPQDLSTGGPWWTSDGNLGIGTTIPTSKLEVRNGNVLISGITTINAGLAGTSLVVEGNARITGILTVGTASITFNGSNNTASIGTSRIVALPAGSSTLWYQASAPTGWTKVTTHHDKCLRIVNTSGGGSGGISTFTGVFRSRTPGGSVSGVNTNGSVANTTATGSVSGSNASGSVSNTTLSTTQIPAHSHSDSGHSHRWGTDDDLGAGGGGNPDANGGTAWKANVETGYASIQNTGGSGAHGHGFTNPTWSGSLTMNAHNHSFTDPTWSGSFSGNAMDFDVQYVDMIIASID